MSVIKVKKYLEEKGYLDRLVKHEGPTDSVANAAITVGCSEGQIAKTMSFKNEDEVIVVVMSGDRKVSNQKYKEYFNVRPRMITFDEVESIIGHAPGGVCPFALNEGIKVYLDTSLKEYDIVYTAGGDSKTTVKLNIDELEKLSNSLGWVDISK